MLCRLLRFPPESTHRAEDTIVRNARIAGRVGSDTHTTRAHTLDPCRGYVKRITYTQPILSGSLCRVGQIFLHPLRFPPRLKSHYSNPVIGPVHCLSRPTPLFLMCPVAAAQSLAKLRCTQDKVATDEYDNTRQTKSKSAKPSTRKKRDA